MICSLENICDSKLIKLRTKQGLTFPQSLVFSVAAVRVLMWLLS